MLNPPSGNYGPGLSGVADWVMTVALVLDGFVIWALPVNLTDTTA